MGAVKAKNLKNVLLEMFGAIFLKAARLVTRLISIDEISMKGRPSK
jgi:hypothetical protein